MLNEKASVQDLQLWHRLPGFLSYLSTKLGGILSRLIIIIELFNRM